VKAPEIEIQKKLAGRYRSLARREFYRRYQDYWAGAILGDTPGNPEATVLDCGSGSGFLLTALRPKFPRVFGLDISLEMLKASRESGGGTGLLASRAQEMALKESAFDLVICKGSLHHLEEPKQALQEIHRILKPEGSLILSEPCRDNAAWRGLGGAATLLSPRFGRGHRPFRSRELKNLLEAGGFRILEERRFGLAGFALCAMAQHFPLMEFIPGSGPLAAFLVRLDEALADRPPARALAWHIIIRAARPGPK
jgi:ubiquinone/menaquinone biosynthesis C-methylase UbiE